jgi:hypothetical protein
MFPCSSVSFSLKLRPEPLTGGSGLAFSRTPSHLDTLPHAITGHSPCPRPQRLNAKAKYGGRFTYIPFPPRRAARPARDLTRPLAEDLFQ